VIKLYALFSVAIFCLWVYCLVDVIQTPDGEARHLPKVGWLLLVLLFPFVGSIAWLAVGRPERRGRRPSAYERSAPAYPEYDRPGRAAAVDAAQDDDFLRQVRARAEEQRRKHEQARRERERERDRPRRQDPTEPTEPTEPV
jgi:hypothetical protein